MIDWTNKSAIINGLSFRRCLRNLCQAAELWDHINGHGGPCACCCYQRESAFSYPIGSRGTVMEGGGHSIAPRTPSEGASIRHRQLKRDTNLPTEADRRRSDSAIRRYLPSLETPAATGIQAPALPSTWRRSPSDFNTSTHVPGSVAPLPRLRVLCHQARDLIHAAAHKGAHQISVEVI